MKIMFVIGIALLVLGIVSFIVPIPHTEREGISAGGVSIGIDETALEDWRATFSSSVPFDEGGAADDGDEEIVREGDDDDG